MAADRDSGTDITSDGLLVGDLAIHLRTCDVYLEGRVIGKITDAQRQLLREFAADPERVFTYEQADGQNAVLCGHRALGRAASRLNRSLNDLRHQAGGDLSNAPGAYLINIRGVGYRLEPPARAAAQLEPAPALDSEPGVPASSPGAAVRTFDPGIGRTIHTLTRITFDDAGGFEAPWFAMARSPARGRLDPVYVRRDIETYLERRLNRERGGLFLIVGDAGVGKTSLLWRQFARLREETDRPLWFHKASQLERHDGHRPSLNPADLVAYAATQERPPYVFLDTLDLMLRDPAGRERVATLLEQLLDVGATIVATCRRHEAAALAVLVDEPVHLNQYSPRELQDAVQRYSKHFYARSPEEGDAERTRLLGAASRGTALTALCFNPLTLRMLFSVYAPRPIPDEVDVFRLYDDFWKQRVMGDLRGGDYQPTDTRDLSTAAEWVALRMLVDGRLDQERRGLESYLAPRSVARSDLDTLITRGVLVRSGHDLRFFHQTFFEHAAARGLIHRAGVEGLQRLGTRVVERTTDLFLRPIYENALLVATAEEGAEAPVADAAIEDLLLADDPSLQTSGLHIYVHRRYTTDASHDAVGRRLTIGERTFTNEFLSLGPNWSSRRSRELEGHLDTIVGASGIANAARLLGILTAATEDRPRAALAFVLRHDLAERIAADSAGSGHGELACVAAELAASLPGDGLEYAFEVLRRYQHHGRGAAIALLLQRLAARRATLGAPDEPLWEHLDRAGVRPSGKHVSLEVKAAVGVLRAADWRQGPDPLGTAIDAVAAAADDGAPPPLLYALNGLTALVRGFEGVDFDRLLAAFGAEQSRGRSHWWMRIVWVDLLLASPPPVRRRLLEVCRAAWRDLAGDRVVQLLSEPRLTQLRTAHLLAIEKRPELLAETREALTPLERFDWRAGRPEPKLLVAGVGAGIQGALSELRRRVANTKADGKQLLGFTTGLAALAPASPAAARALAELVGNTGHWMALQRLLDGSATVPPPLGEPSYDGFWMEVLAGLLASRSSDAQILGARILRLRVAPRGGLLTSRELDDIFARVTTPGALAEILRALPQCIDDPEAVFLRVRGCLGSPHASVVDAALEAMTDAARMPTATADLVDETTTGVLAPPTHPGRLSRLGWLIEAWAPRDAPAAARVARRLLGELGEDDIGRAGKRKVAARLRKPMRTLFRHASAAERTALLEQVRGADADLARAVIEAAAHEVFEAVRVHLADLLADPAVPSETRELIRRHEFHRGRGHGSTRWDDLTRLLTPT